MRVKYVKDLHIPAVGEWSSDEIADPMHPIHGPLPDHFGMLEYDGERFFVMLWETRRNIQIFLEWAIEDDPDEDVPMLSIDEACRMQGKLGRTYYWIAEEGEMICEGHSVSIPQQIGDEDQWRRKIYRRLMEASVWLAATKLIGF